MIRLSFSKLIPKRKGDRFVAICIFIFVVAMLLHEIFFWLNILTNPWLEWILSVLVVLGLSLSMGSVILVGIRRLRKEGVTAKILFLTVSGILVCILSVFLQWRIHKSADSLFNILEIQDFNTQKLDQLLASGKIDMETYSKTSLIIAQNRFFKDGSITEYTSPDGHRVLYEPNEGDQQTYMEMHQMRDYIRGWSTGTHLGVYYWSAIALFSTVMGFVTPIRNKGTSD